MFKHLPASTAWFTAIFAALGTVFVVVGLQQVYRNWQFSGNVAHVMGNATRAYTTHSSGRHGSSTTYHVAFQYQAGDKRYTTSDSVTWGTYASVDPPAAIPVKYLPESPGIARIDLRVEDRQHAQGAWMFTLLGLVFAGFGWFMFIGLERLIFYRRWLRARGWKCVGRVERIDASSMTSNNRAVRYLVYSYTDGSGQKREDSSEGLSQKEEALWSDGDPIVVHYDPRDSSRSTVRVDQKEVV